MNIQFKIKEHTSDIIKNIRQLVKQNQFVNGISYEQDGHDANRIFLVCEDFGNNEGGSAVIQIYDENTMKVTTAFSCFTYYFNNNNVFYTGAYRGLLQQNLLPSFTPIVTGDEMVYSSMFFSGITLLEYADFQEKFTNLKAQNEGMTHYHIHPFHVQQILDAREDMEIGQAERQAEEYPQ